MNKQELTEGILYRLESITVFAQAIHAEIKNGLDITDEYRTIENIDRKLADLCDLAEEHRASK